jgi:hypothetical protein
MVVLEYHHELLRHLLHYVQDVVSEAVLLHPLTHIHPLHRADDLPQPLFKLAVIAPGFGGNDTAFELAWLFTDFCAVTYDVDINFGQRILHANAAKC